MIAAASEVLIALQFTDPIASLNALQVVHIANAFPEFPQYSEAALAGPMAYKLEHLDGTEPLEGFAANFPRVMLHSAAGNRVLSFQADRLTYSWLRTTEVGEQDDYPGFDTLVEELQPLKERFIALLKAGGLDTVSFRVAEIVYVNTIPTRTTTGEKFRLSEIFSFLSPSNSAPINGYFYAWNERLAVADGILRVQVVGPVIYAPQKPAASFTLSGTFLIADYAMLNSELLTVRARMRKTYERVLIEDRRG